jgi:hypothetical protein
MEKWAVFVVLLCVGCGGSAEPGKPCDQQAALDAFKVEHGEVYAVGEWKISTTCVVTQIAPPL